MQSISVELVALILFVVIPVALSIYAFWRAGK
jgi:antibiotic biosynthesis monooxygenase (ABM) superfamily enzyme